jgi:fatty acid-binding protein DegV
VLDRLVEVVTESCQGGEDAHLCVLQVEAEKEAQTSVEELKTKVPVSNIPVYELSPAIVIHAGPKAMGVGFFLK